MICDGKKILNEQCEGLVASISLEEIRAALFEIDNEKAPRSDGFGALFFKAFWYIISNNIFDAVHEFFRSEKLLKQWNHAIIALIPKSASANGVNYYRSIVDNVQLAQELLRMYTRKRTPAK